MLKPIHPSGLYRYTQCERMAHARLHPMHEDHVNVSALVGTWAHLLLASSAERNTCDILFDETCLEDPEDLECEVLYDATTPTIRAARLQATAIANEVVRTLESEGLNPVSSEVEVDTSRVRGRVDLVCSENVGEHQQGIVVCDLKTGRLTGQEWLQLGAYSHAMREDGYRPNQVAIIHAPRTKAGIPFEATVTRRAAREVEVAAKRWIERVLSLDTEEDMPTVSPGAHCAYCNAMSCGLRAVERKNH